MSALVLDAGAFIAIERGDRAMAARLRAAATHDLALRTNAMVVAQVWRNPSGRQAQLARLLRAVDVREIDDPLGRAAGELLARTGTDDPVDASVVLVANVGDRVVTSDVVDLKRLAEAAGARVAVVSC